MKATDASRQTTDQPGFANGPAPWLALAAFHFLIIVFLSEVLAFAWIHVALVPALVAGWRYGKVPRDLVLCFLAALGFLLAEPAIGLGFAVVFSFVPFSLLILEGQSSRALFWKGIWTGWLVGAGIYAWIIPTLGLFFESDWWKLLPVFFVLTGVIALQIGAFVLLAAFTCERTAVSPLLVIPAVYTVCEHWLSLPMGIPLPLAFSFQPFWIQSLDLLGVGGTTFLMVLCGTLLGRISRMVLARDWPRTVGPSLQLTVLVLAIAGYGLFRTSGGVSNADPKTFRILQPVSPLRVQNKDVETQQEVADRLLALSTVTVGDAATPVIVWPEGAAAFSPTNPAFNAPYFESLRESQRLTSATVVAHGVDFERDAQGRLQYRSAIFIVEPVGKVSDVFHKQILMPFGEYLPFESTFPILRKLLPDARSILSGGRDQPLILEGVRIAPVICYEVLFPRHVSRLVQPDVGIIVVLTNDRWYGIRQQPLQHLSFAVLRAIENRRPVVRGAHSGISAFIDEAGRIEQRSMTKSEEITHTDSKVSPHYGRTLYSRVGEILPRAILPLFLVACLLWKNGPSRESKSKNNHPSPKGKESRK